MPDPTSNARRRAVRLIAGAPLLPFSAAFAGDPPAGDAAAATGTTISSARFAAMPAPGLDAPAEMATASVRSALEVVFADRRRARWPLAYETLFITGDRVPDGRGGERLAGGCYDIAGRPIVDRSLPGRERPFVSDCPDGMTLLALPDAQVPGVEGNAVFAVVQFEYVTRDASGRRLAAPLPMPLAVLTLDQDRATGRLRLVQYRDVDLAPAHGLWTPCAATLSPWNTHLSSEEYPPDATAAATSAWFRGFSRNLYGDPDRGNPYRYGHVPEVTVHPDGSGSVRKHYCLGRISREIARVMPDERTVLMGDDWDNGGLFMFVAARSRDLSAGTLYVARWESISSRGPGAARLAWIRLGTATSAQIEALIDGGIRAADIMDVRTAEPDEAGYTRIPFEGRFNWVRLRPGMALAAAFLETHRCAALVGGSLGFTKMEGVAVDARERTAYVAMSRIDTSMSNGSGGIRVEGPYSGAVYALVLRDGQLDTDGRPIGSAWVPVDMVTVAELVAVDFGGGKRKQQDALGNYASADRIAGPDNLAFSEALRTLFIGEDSSTHVNNFLWAYQVDTRTLSRILSYPAGAESTGLQAVDDLNGWTYITSNVQHPGDWQPGLHDQVRASLDPLIRARYRDGYGGAVGYLTALPTGIRLK